MSIELSNAIIAFLAGTSMIVFRKPFARIQLAWQNFVRLRMRGVDASAIERATLIVGAGFIAFALFSLLDALLGFGS